MSENSDKPDKDEELEALLQQLVPTPLHVGFISELNLDQERIALNRAQNPTRVQWKRVIPLTLVCSIVMLGFGILRYGSHFSSPDDAGIAANLEGVAQEERFVPVSAHGYLMNTSSGGVIETDEGPRERLLLDYRDAYHWHDPTSGTNIRFFQPRREEVIIPLQTD